MTCSMGSRWMSRLNHDVAADDRVSIETVAVAEAEKAGHRDQLCH
jgi:hypothetical protein